jgi:UDP-glucose 4-epimerase
MTVMGNARSMWILGRGGFLGTAIAREAARGGYSVFPQKTIPWNSPSQRQSVLKATAQEFSAFARDTTPTIVWAAGSEGVAISDTNVTSERDSFADFVSVLSQVDTLFGATVVVVSSAGGVFSGSPTPPFSCDSPVQAINEYGRNKIAIEEMVFAELNSQYRVHVARITNLYGPWSGPRQGLINRLCTAAATREALQIYVPLDTVRDYIYVSDAARLLLLEIDLAQNSEASPSISLIGSGENSSIGTVINTVAHVSHRKIPVTMAQVGVTQLQPRDLRMQPSWSERELSFEPSTLAQGVKKLFDSLVTVPRWN